MPENRDIQIMDNNPELAQRVLNDVWDLFGTLTRDQSETLLRYFEQLTQAGVLVQPKMGTVSAQPALPTDVPKADQTE